jgi:3-oxoacyl-[acyl-carrier protein] reductase
MDLGLRGRVAFVTGSSKGLGRALALALGREGARVALTYYQDEAGGKETARQIEEAGGQALPVFLDLSDETSLVGAVQLVTATLGTIEVLINSAVAWPGFPPPGERFETAPIERLHTSLRANLEGHYRLSQLIVGGMREVAWGRIVHISTGLVLDGLPGSSAYVMAKAGLHGLTRTMSRELAREGILTNLVMAGFMADERRQFPESVLQQARAAAATGRTTRPEEVASLVIYLCSAANTNVTGELIRADGHFLTPA